MTTWQDQQPQSRRALRESERAHAQATLSDALDVEADEDIPETDFDQQIWQSQSEPLTRDSATLETPDLPQSSEPDSADGPFRRPRKNSSTRSVTDPVAAETPPYRLRDFSPERRGSSFTSTQSAPWTPPSPGSENLSYHTSVDANRQVPKSSLASASTPPVVVTREEASASHVATPPRAHEGHIEHTLTRRELREMRRAAVSPVEDDLVEPTSEFALTSESVPTPVSAPEDDAPDLQEPELYESELQESDLQEPELYESELQEPELYESELQEPELYESELQEPVDLVEPPTELMTPAAMAEVTPQDDELAAAMAEFDRLFEERQREPQQIPPLVEPSSEQGPSAVIAAPPELAAQLAPAPLPVELQPDPVQPFAESVPAPAPDPEAGQQMAPPRSPVPIAPVPIAPEVYNAEPLREVVTAPEVYAAPEGHWSNQTAMNEGAESKVRPHKRDIAASDAITTNALVLPNFPVSMPTTGPVKGTGEVLMTGSINLPRSLGVNGLHPSRYDRADIDEIIDASDREDAAPDSAPVRAVRAVSTYTSSQGIINMKRPKGNNLPMVLSITAGVMMVGVVVLVVVGMIFKIF